MAPSKVENLSAMFGDKSLTLKWKKGLNYR